METNNLNLCRLCFDEGFINIFDENGQLLEISTIIKQHLDCEADENDVLPKYVCSVCWNQVRSFHSFYEFVKKAQNTFITNQIKPEISTELTPTFADEDTSDILGNSFIDSEDVLLAEQNVALETELVEPQIIGSENAFTGKSKKKLGKKCESQVKKKVGRPRKKTNRDVSSVTHNNTNAVNTTRSHLPTQGQEPDDIHLERMHDKLDSPEVVVKRKMGRPRKDVKKSDSEYEPDQVSSESELEQEREDSIMEKASDNCMADVKRNRKRGRPRKRKSDDDEHELSNSKMKNRMPRGEDSKFRSTYTLDENYEAFMLQNFNMSCELCSATDFKSFFDVKTHYMDDHKFSHGYIKCCNNKKFIYISQVKDHIDFHLNPDVLKCKLCGKHNKSKVFLRKHMREVHEQKTRFKCDICGHATNREPNIKLHILRMHVPKNPDFKCDECRREFSSMEVLKTHKFVIHERQYNKRYTQCEICGKSIKIFQLARHRIIHSDKESRLKNRAQCDICLGWFSSVGSLAAHKTIHIAGEEQCEECHKVFASKFKLNRHIHRMHRERQYKCTFCSSAFDRKTLLRRHMESHTRVKQYPCLFCSKIFHVQKSMHVHYSRHHRAEFEEVKRQKRIERLGGP